MNEDSFIFANRTFYVKKKNISLKNCESVFLIGNIECLSSPKDGWSDRVETMDAFYSKSPEMSNRGLPFLASRCF
jgi:hypothetical protein